MIRGCCHSCHVVPVSDIVPYYVSDICCIKLVKRKSGGGWYETITIFSINEVFGDVLLTRYEA